MVSFLRRHLGPNEVEQQEMLRDLGFTDLSELLAAALPEQVVDRTPMEIPAPKSESEVLAELAEMAGRNQVKKPLIGLGYYATETPAVIRRNILENPAWYTAYTPYQPEISQGRLEALFNFQTMIAELTGLPVVGASLLDEATAVAEAAGVAKRITRGKGPIVADANLLPQSKGVLHTRMAAANIEVIHTASIIDTIRSRNPFAVIVQVPGADGRMPDLDELAELTQVAHEHKALVIASVDLLSLTLVTPPAAWGADIVVGSTQRFGVPLFYGGPHAAFIALPEGKQRQMPGRIVGESVDSRGNRAYRLALQAREQHIKRERATSNICTSQVLLAVAASMYAVYHGPAGLTRIAETCHSLTRRLAAALQNAGHEIVHESFFDTITVKAPGKSGHLVRTAREAGFELRHVDPDHVGISLGETITEADLEELCEVFNTRLPEETSFGDLAGHVREPGFLSQKVFNSYHTETSMMRYLRALADRDFALDRGMIPLGSCTMKLNPAAALEPISYPGFANLHPLVPASEATGYIELVERLSKMLLEITGYDAVSLQPNGGSQGELAGLLAIQRYHRARGESGRHICLIPASAHGTNAASAALSGMKVVVVATADDGSIDMQDLAAKCNAHRDELAAIMVTYPSTHGVYEDTITELCEMVHDCGGQVYVDGANMNALVGWAKPGKFGADVSHLNLHKTFAIPHGGGGPGVGPVACREHLAPHLPGNPQQGTDAGAVSGAIYGSAGVLAISYAYISMLSDAGLRRSTEVAVLNANYVAHRLGEYFPILYRGRSGLVAHECILDLRPLCEQAGLTIDDIAKRLIDYGFHAPTMSFPVAGTLMVEPTESESRRELDRFCDAMIAIHGEIGRILDGTWDADDNPLVGAPHCLGEATTDTWTHAYSRQEAVHPLGQVEGPLQGICGDKYWPPVGRIDGVHGDRNLICSCPPVSDYR